MWTAQPTTGPPEHGCPTKPCPRNVTELGGGVLFLGAALEPSGSRGESLWLAPSFLQSRESVAQGGRGRVQEHGECWGRLEPGV